MLETPLERLLERLPPAKPAGKNKWLALCPAHEDHTPSLSIGLGDDGRVLLKCQAGCATTDVCKALGLGMRDLFTANNERERASNRRAATKPKPTAEGETEAPAPWLRPVEAVYNYKDEQGMVLHGTVRFSDGLQPRFSQRRPNGRGGFHWNLTGVETVLFKLAELLKADPTEWVYVCEGEKDVLRLQSLGLVATTNPMGGLNWKDEYSEYLRGRRVAIMEDNDLTGRRRSAKVANSLGGKAAEIKALALPGLAEGEDVSDWFDRGGTVDELNRIADAAPAYQPADPEPTPSQSPVRLSQLCDEFLKSLEPEWHRNGRSIYFVKLGHEVTLPSLWALANDSIIDKVAGTVEGLEITQAGSRPKYRVRLSLFEKSVRMAGAALLAKMPALADVPKDATLDECALLDRLVACLLHQRTFRTDTGTSISTTYYSWASEIDPASSWRQCFTASVFGRIDSTTGNPQIAIKAAVLSAELKYETTRRMIKDLTGSGFAEKTTIKVARCGSWYWPRK